jgi:Sigma-70, region 4
VSVGDLTRGLSAIPERQRRALLLREWQGLSYGEIARELGVSMAAVETLLFRARRSLAGQLGQTGTTRRSAALAWLGTGVRWFFDGGAAPLKLAAAAGAVATTATLVAAPAVRRHDGAPAPVKVAPQLTAVAPAPRRHAHAPARVGLRPVPAPRSSENAPRPSVGAALPDSGPSGAEGRPPEPGPSAPAPPAEVADAAPAPPQATAPTFDLPEVSVPQIPPLPAVTTPVEIPPVETPPLPDLPKIP